MDQTVTSCRKNVTFPTIPWSSSKLASGQTASIGPITSTCESPGGITRGDILQAIDTYEVIESYPDDKYLPSYLLLSSPAGSGFHALFAVDVDGNNVRIVTAYRPDPAEWEPDLRTRRKTQ